MQHNSYYAFRYGQNRVPESRGVHQMDTSNNLRVIQEVRFEEAVYWVGCSDDYVRGTVRPHSQTLRLFGGGVSEDEISFEGVSQIHNSSSITILWYQYDKTV